MATQVSALRNFIDGQLVDSDGDKLCDDAMALRFECGKSCEKTGAINKRGEDLRAEVSL